jgi:hypothetical protein
MEFDSLSRQIIGCAIEVHKLCRQAQNIGCAGHVVYLKGAGQIASSP